MKLKTLLPLLALVITLVSCGRSETKNFAEQINGSTGKHFVSVRDYGKNGNGNYSVFKDESTGKYWAVNVEAFEASGMSAAEFFAANKGVGSELVVSIKDITTHTETNMSYTYETQYIEHEDREYISDDEAYDYGYDGYDYLNDSYYLSYYWDEEVVAEVPYYYDVTVNDYNGVNGMVFEDGTSDKKDLEKIAAEMEGQEVSEVAEGLVAKFGLSEERATEVAKIQNAYNKVSSKRSLTKKDQDTLTKELVGTDYASAQAALESHLNGDSDSMDELLDKAAKINGTTPEHMTEILGDVLLK